MIALCAALGLLLLALAACTTLRLRRAYHWRARQLIDAARKMAGGDLTARAGLDGGDDLSAVGSALDELAERLASARGELAADEQRSLLADRLSVVGTLAAGVAHEINNPLAYVISNLEYIGDLSAMLARRSPDSRAALGDLPEAVAESLAGAQRVRRLVADLQTFARHDGVLEPVELAPLLDAVLNLAAHELRGRAQVVRGFSDCPRVLGHPGWMAQLFFDLILGAARRMPPGRARDHRLRVATGVRPDGRVFAEFEGNGLENADADASGCLSLCQGILGGMNGLLELEKTVAGGTLVRVLLAPAVETLHGAAPRPQASAAA